MGSWEGASPLYKAACRKSESLSENFRILHKSHLNDKLMIFFLSSNILLFAILLLIDSFYVALAENSQS